MGKPGRGREAAARALLGSRREAGQGRLGRACSEPDLLFSLGLGSLAAGGESGATPGVRPGKGAGRCIARPPPGPVGRVKRPVVATRAPPPQILPSRSHFEGSGREETADLVVWIPG